MVPGAPLKSQEELWLADLPIPSPALSVHPFPPPSPPHLFPSPHLLCPPSRTQWCRWRRGQRVSSLYCAWASVVLIASGQRVDMRIVEQGVVAVPPGKALRRKGERASKRGESYQCAPARILGPIWSALRPLHAEPSLLPWCGCGGDGRGWTQDAVGGLHGARSWGCRGPRWEAPARRSTDAKCRLHIGKGREGSPKVKDCLGD